MQTNEILETIKMIDEEYLDIRTITMGISLLDCMDPDIHVSCQKVEEKICRLAKDLVKVEMISVRLMVFQLLIRELV